MSDRGPRPILTLGAIAALATAFVAGSVLAGSAGSTNAGGSPERPLGGTDSKAVAFEGSDLSLAASCDELLEWYVDHGVDRVRPWGWDSPYGYAYNTWVGGDVVMDSAASGSSEMRTSALAPTAPLAKTSRVTNGANGTNVQEVGVDEPDVVKTDGRTLFRVEGNDLVTYDVTGDEVVRIGSVHLPDAANAEILLSGGTVVAIGQETTGGHGYDYETGGEPAETQVLVVDVTDPATPEVEHSYRYDTALVTARLHGSTVRLVVQAGLPDLEFTTPDRRKRQYDERAALRENQQIVRESAIEDWLPTVTVDGGGPEQFLDCDQVALPDDGDTLGTIAVVGFAADDPADTSVSGLAVDTQLAYASVDQLYLATTPMWGGGGCWECVERLPVPGWFPGGPDSSESGITHVYAFDLDGLDTTYAASGEVDGMIRDRWAMDESGGVLRLAVSPTQRTGNFNSVVTLRQEDNDLVETGRLDKLGVDEDIKAVRWFDGLAIVVTFRQVDPLYAIDLTDAETPTLMGVLKIPGFSGYLHPLGQHRLLGLGEGPSDNGRRWGAQAGLFNVTDLADPKQLDVVSYGGNTHANAVEDPRQLTWLPDRRTVLSVITDWGKGTTGYVSVLELGDGELTNRMVEVEYGDEVAQVRLVPMPDGRVVLVTGDDAEFFAL